MTRLSELSKLFYPLQPRFKEGGNEVIYKEFVPDPLLLGNICCYWQLQSPKPLSRAFLYTAIADGCIDLFFDLNDRYEDYVMGFSSTCTSFLLKKDFNYVGIRFFPGAFPSLYNIAASALANQCQHTGLVIPHAYQTLFNLLADQVSLEHIKPLFDNYFKEIVYSKNTAIDLRFVESFNCILESQGILSVENDIPTNVSKRHLRRLFDFYIGASPKEFNRILRFQRFLRRNTNRESLKKEKIYYEMGYYDQSHFIKDFKSLYGITPLKAFM